MKNKNILNLLGGISLGILIVGKYSKIYGESSIGIAIGLAIAFFVSSLIIGNHKDIE